MEATTMRGWQTADAGPYAELINTIERRAGGHGGLTTDDVARVAAAHLADPERDARICVDGSGALIAAAATLLPPAGGYQLELTGGVHPDWRGRGIGRDLLDWQLARARQIHAERAPDQRWEAHVVALLGDESALALFTRFGLTPARYWFDMVARLDPAIAPGPATAPDPATITAPVGDGLRVAPYASEFDAETYAAHQEAFADHWGFQSREWDEWVPLAVGSQSFRPELSLLAIADPSQAGEHETTDGEHERTAAGRVAGYVLSYLDADPTCVYVGQVGVRRGWRRQGVAGGLLSRVLTLAAAGGAHSVRLAVDADSPTGAVSVYERAGFTMDSRMVTYRMELPPTELDPLVGG